MSKTICTISELGQEYLPEVTAKRAADWMRSIISTTPGLKAALLDAGFRPRSITPRMREIIYRFIGEP